MKKIIAILALTMMAVAAVTACGGKKESSTAPSFEGETMTAAGPNGTTIVMPATTPEETNPENGLPLSKQPDATAPVLASIVVYAPDNDGKMTGMMDAAEKLDGETVVNLLISHGTLAEGVKFVSLDETDSSETAAAGPGAASAETQKNGKLTLSSFSPASGVGEEDAKQAVIDTFRENFELNELELVIE